MTKPTLYAFPAACSRVTLTALEEIGGDYDVRWINITADAQYEPEFLATNRKAKAPALSVNGATLSENAAILYHLHSENPSVGLLPDLDGEFGAVRGLSDLIWCGGMLHPMVRQIRAPQKWTQNADEIDGIRADGMKKLAKECAYIEQQLSKSLWWYGDAWSIVDVYLYWVCSTAAKLGFPLADYSAITAHADRVRGLPAFNRALENEIAGVKSEGLPVEIASL